MPYVFGPPLYSVNLSNPSPPTCFVPTLSVPLCSSSTSSPTGASNPCFSRPSNSTSPAPSTRVGWTSAPYASSNESIFDSDSRVSLCTGQSRERKGRLGCRLRGWGQRINKKWWCRLFKGGGKSGEGGVLEGPRWREWLREWSWQGRGLCNWCNMQNRSRTVRCWVYKRDGSEYGDKE